MNLLNLKQYSIMKRLSLIGIVALLGLGASWAAHQSMVGNLVDISKAETRAGDLMETLDRLAGSLREENIAIQDYVLNRKIEKLAMYKELSVENNKALSNLVKGLSVEGARVEAVSMQTIMADYDRRTLVLKAARQKVGLNKDDGLTGQLRDSVHTVEKYLKAIHNDKLMVSMLMLRRHEKDFMLRGLEKYITKHQQEVEKFDALLSRMDMSASSKRKIAGAMDNYAKSFHAYAIAHADMLTQAKSLDDLFQNKLYASYHKTDDLFATYLTTLDASYADVLLVGPRYYLGIMLAVFLLV
ncbi:MAG: hypothetical protein Q9M21_07885, partial [Mariprofundaceae bacterium]|nr:hypothetical protein [Mariprofundaceae bacterium]